MAASRTRLALVAGAAGLAGGLALGVTGLASAADPSPSPSGSTDRQQLERRFMDHGRPFGDRFGPGMRKHHGNGGLVQSVSGSSVTVLTGDGRRTIALNDATSYYVGREQATRSVVQKGLVVRIRLVDPRADKPVAAVITVVPAHVVGWVTDVAGSAITVTDLSGFTRTIRTDGSTAYVKEGETATRSIVVEGALVRATGQVADDGTTLEADRVTVGRPLHKRAGAAPPAADEPDA